MAKRDLHFQKDICTKINEENANHIAY